MLEQFIGKYVICRTRNEGVNAGVVVAIDKDSVMLEDARRLHYHRPANSQFSWYEGVALSGISEDSRVSEPTTKLIREEYSLTLCSGTAEASIRGAKSHAQTR